ncbi:NAD(P)-dependent oxidoreductase [archaeon]|nr:MAG: NAD(P)-dependent oxidoreductase [archaeon]
MSLYARISRLHSTTIFMPRNCRLFSHQSKASDKPIGFIGLGHMGSKMVRNFAADGHSVMVFDASPQAIDDTVALGGSKVTPATSVENVASHCNVVFSMLPNDKIVEEVSKKLLAGSHQNLTHISCSTISPTLSRQMVQLYHSKKSDFVAGPVFARPDGLARREATFMVAGSSEVWIR